MIFLTQATEPEINRNLPQLTWLRGIAAILVITSHCLRATEVSYGYGDEASQSVTFRLLDLGSFGVVCFFTLSGCTLYLSNASKLTLRGLPVFYLKRFLRVWPAFFVSLISYLLFRVAFQAAYGERRFVWVEGSFMTPYNFTDLVTYASFSSNLTGPQGLFNNAYWSLPVEFQYYLLFPSIVWFALRFGFLAPLGVGLIALLVTRSAVTSFFDSNLVFKLMFTFCAGISLGYLADNTRVRLAGWCGLSLFVLCLCGASAITQLSDEWLSSTILPEKWILFGGIAIASVAALLLSAPLLTGKAAATLEHLGNISYGLYLFHNLFLGLAVIALIRLQVISGETKSWVALGITLPLTILAAQASFNFVELPAIRYSRRVRFPLADSLWRVQA